MISFQMKTPFTEGVCHRVKKITKKRIMNTKLKLSKVCLSVDVKETTCV